MKATEARLLDLLKKSPQFVISNAPCTIADHPYLAEGSEMYGNKVPQLFAALRHEILALDSGVSEEFRKQYVAYRAETNFVDVIPQARRLILSLNIRFAELDDPKGLCKDVSGLGHWGNGEVEMPLAQPEELPYVLGLIRQALERQLGNGSDT